ncbi:MAG: hypothetical protein AAFV53_34405 [Myxococcota bacterium]
MNRNLLLLMLLTACGRLPKSMVVGYPKDLPDRENILYKVVLCPEGSGRMESINIMESYRYHYFPSNSDQPAVLFEVRGSSAPQGYRAVNSWKTSEEHHFLWGVGRNNARHVTINESTGTGRHMAYFPSVRLGSKIRVEEASDGSWRNGDSIPASIHCLERIET